MAMKTGCCNLEAEISCSRSTWSDVSTKQAAANRTLPDVLHPEMSGQLDNPFMSPGLIRDKPVCSSTAH